MASMSDSSMAELMSASSFSLRFCKQKTAYEIKECDWSSDVCSSDLSGKRDAQHQVPPLDRCVNTMAHRQVREMILRTCRCAKFKSNHPGVSAGGLNPWLLAYRTRSEERRVGKECRSR